MKAVMRVFAAVLPLAMVFGFCGVFPARAAAGVWDGSVDISWYDPSASDYYIETPAQLAGLAALTNGMTDPDCPGVIGDASYIKSIKIDNVTLVGAGGGDVRDTVYGSDIDFAYKTIYITADLDMGGAFSDGGWSGPNWTPIGGKFPMKPEEARGDCLTLDTRFNGILDGQGHTVSNIFCDRFAAKGFPYSMAAGLVGFLGGVRDNIDGGNRIAEFDHGWQPAVKNVTLGGGYIYARRMVGGVVGRIGTTSNGVIVENCANFAEIHNTDSKGIGGIVGSGWGSGVIRNCYNVGSVTTTYACPAGGICGSNSGMSIYNCYNTGAIDSNGEARGRGIGGHDAGSYTVGNCYYLEGCDDDPASGGWYTGNSRNITVDVKPLTSAEMKSPEFIDMLNASGRVFAPDAANINNGYPILYYQAQGYIGTGSFNVRIEQPAAGGTVSSDLTGTAAAGRTVTLSAQPEAGWTLKYFTLGGSALDADFFTVSADSVVSAVFSEVRQARVTLPASGDSYYSFSKTGFELLDGKMVYAESKAIDSGDILLEENTIRFAAIPYDGAAPQDPDMEYTGAYTVTATNAEKNADGTFTVTGTGDVVFTVEQSTALKSWTSLADTSWYTGAGDVYTLTTSAQLAGMAKLVNAEGVDFKGITILLGNDISLENADGTIGGRIWEACGRTMSRCFSGTFDGQGYSIYDMTAYNAGSYAGLFGYCTEAVIKNVTVRGTVAGRSSTAYAGGIISYASGCIIENCINRAEIDASGTGAAGIAAYICDGTTVTGCENRAAVSGTTGVGGIVGICYSSEDVITDCCNYGEIAASGDGSNGTGGIAGELAGAMSGCGNFAAVDSSDRYTGGLVGYATSRLGSDISSSVSTGGIYSGCANQSAAVGSAVGYAQYLAMENVSATGAVSTGAGFVSPGKGGAIGREGTVTQTGTNNEALLPKNVPDNDKWIHPPGKQGPWTITFIADDETVGAAVYTSASETIEEPPVPEKPGFTASWSHYILGNRDLVVHAIYRRVFVRGGESITSSGVYFPDPNTAGEVSISAGLIVTLSGECGECDGIYFTVGQGT